MERLNVLCPLRGVHCIIYANTDETVASKQFILCTNTVAGWCTPDLLYYATFTSMKDHYTIISLQEQKTKLRNNLGRLV